MDKSLVSKLKRLLEQKAALACNQDILWKPGQWSFDQRVVADQAQATFALCDEQVTVGQSCHTPWKFQRCSNWNQLKTRA